MSKRIAAVSCLVFLAAASATAGDWWESVKVKGDLRYRHEMLDSEQSDSRHRHRVRARIGVEGQVSEYTKAVVQLASGSDDPVSTNQTLDEASSTKRMGLDLAYFETTHGQIPGLRVTGGKFKNPFFKPGSSELLWDADWNPEGGTFTFARELKEVTVTIIGAGLWIDERSSADDSWLGAGQGIIRFHIPDSESRIAIGGAYFNYVNTEGLAPFFDASDAFGNSTGFDADSSLIYANDYEIVEVFGEATYALGSHPVTVMGDYVINTAADSLDTGWLMGVRIGQIKEPGSWMVRYNYRKVEKDAVVGTFTDSDFRDGGTDAKGHEINGCLQLAARTAFNVSYFINKIGLQAEETDFNRLQVDLQVKF